MQGYVYVQLPRELWTPQMHKMCSPVVRIKKALYGHKLSGNYWEKTETCWRYHRNVPQLGLVNPNRPKSPSGPDGYKDLNGQLERENKILL